MREALNQVVLELRGEVRSSSIEMRRHFDVVGESLRSGIRGITECLVASREQTRRRIDENGVRADLLDGRVLRLEVRVSRLVKDRKPRPSRRGR